MKPIVNLDEVIFDDIEDNGHYTSQRARFSAGIGARKLCPFHKHHGEEEMFFILEGHGELRFGDQRHPLRPHDVIACPTGGREVAHQIINTGTATMRYLAVSNRVEIEVCEYPDSDKIAVSADSAAAGPALHKMFRAENTVGYYDRDRDVQTTDPESGPPSAQSHRGAASC